MGEFDFYDGQRDSDGRQRRRRQRLNYEDDGLGMADAADQADGSFANIEDYAGGMIDEFGQDNRYSHNFDDNSAQGFDDAPVLPNPRYRRPGAPVPPLDPNQPSPALQRAAQLMERTNRRGRPATIDAPQGRARRRYEDDYVDESKPGGNILESLAGIGKGLNLNIPGLPNIDTRGVGKISNTILIALGVIAFLLCSCLFLLTAWIISLFS